MNNQTKTDDPLEFYKKYYKITEDIWSNIFEKSMSTETFASVMGSQMENYLQFLKMMKENNEKTLQNLNLPTINDFARLATQIVLLETKVDAVNDKIDKILDLIQRRSNKTVRNNTNTQERR